MANILEKLGNLLSGGLFDGVADLVTKYMPPDMSPAQLAELDLALRKLDLERTNQLSQALADSERAVTERIAALEGTAQDLRAVPVVGPVVIFFRGMQRLVWGYGTLYANFMWFSGKWLFTTQQESAMWIINILVLGFLFGERAIQNVAPLLSELMSKRTVK